MFRLSVRWGLPALGAAHHGALSGRASASAGGKAAYTIPLELPPGRLGLVPDLSLGDWAIERLASEIHAYKEVLLHDADMKSLQVLFAKLGVERDSPLLMPALLDPEGKPYSYWS